MARFTCQQGYDPYDSWSSREWIETFDDGFGKKRVLRWNDVERFFDHARPKFPRAFYGDEFAKPATYPRDPRAWPMVERANMNDPASGLVH